MKTNNRAKEVFDMIKEYSKVNEQERAEIDRRLKEENEKEADAKEAARVAQETLNDEAYLDAQNALARIEARKRMLHGRADQIDSLRRITDLHILKWHDLRILTDHGIVNGLPHCGLAVLP